VHRQDVDEHRSNWTHVRRSAGTRRHRIHHIGSVHVADSASSAFAAKFGAEQACARGVAAPMVPLFCCSASFACGALTALQWAAYALPCIEERLAL